MKILKIFTVLAVIAFGFSSSVQAQIFYKVEKPGSDKISYILGTHHFAPLSVVDSISEMPAILESVDKLYGEIDMSQMTDPGVMMGMQKYLIAPADSTLDNLLTPAQVDSVRVVWDEYTGGAMPFDMMKMMKPAMLSTTLAAAMAQKALPSINALEGIDMTMQNRARQLGKPVEGLETMEFQMNMLYGQPINKQIDTLMETVRTANEEQTSAIELTEAYLAHNLDKILDLMIKAENNDPVMIEQMIYGRNANWVEQLLDLLPQQSLMVVVGAGHLPGERGVLEGLRKAGYNVTPIR